MMACDAQGNSVEYGDWVRFDVKEGPEIYFIGTVVELVERRRGVGMVVAFVDDDDKRLKVGKYAADPASVTVIMRADGTLVVPDATQLYPPSSVYCITPTTEPMARAVARNNRPQPVSRWELTAAPETPMRESIPDEGPDDAPEFEGEPEEAF